MKLVLPIAGKGTRVRPITHSIAKPLIPVAGKPILQRIIDQVRAVQGIDLTGVIFITGHLEEQVQEWARDTYDDLGMAFITQEAMNGSAGAVQLAEELVGDEDMLIIFADTLFDADLEVMLEDAEADGIIWAAEVEDPRRFGVVAHDEDRIMTGLIEKPDEPPSNLVNIGVYYIKNSKAAFSMIDALYERNIRTKGEYNFPEALDLMAKNGEKIRVVPVEGWFDCGTHDTLLATNKTFCEREGIENGIAKSAIIEDSTLFNCIVMEGARVQKSDLQHSIIGPRSIIKHTKGQVIVGSDAAVQGNDNR